VEWAAWTTELSAALAHVERASPLLWTRAAIAPLPTFSPALHTVIEEAIAVIDEAIAIIEGSDDRALARDIIEVRGPEAVTVARENARSTAVAGQAAQAKLWIRVLGSSSGSRSTVYRSNSVTDIEEAPWNFGQMRPM